MSVEHSSKAPAPADIPENAALVRPLLFSTTDLPPADQFDAWRSFIAPTVDLDLRAAPQIGFTARQEIWDLGSLAFTAARMPGTGFVREWRHWRDPAVDHWCLVLCEAPAGPALGIRSLASPFQGTGADREVLSLFIPRDLFATTKFDAAPNELPVTGMGGILADHLRSLARQLGTTRPADLPRLAEATQALLAACIAPSADAHAAAQDAVNQTLRSRARRFIREHLTQPDLSPDTLCRALGVSRSRLYRLFEEQGGVAGYIQRLRLRAALAALSDPRDRRTIMQVAEAFAFHDPSGFSRAFRAAFGFSPSDARAGAVAGHPRRPAPAPAANAAERDLGRVLAGLRP